MPSLTTLPATATVDDVVEVLDRDGGVIVKDAVSQELISRVFDEIKPYLDLTPWGEGDFMGTRTRRTSSILAKSPSYAEVVLSPHLLGAAEAILGREKAYSWVGEQRLDSKSRVQISCTSAIYIFPGETAQPLHRDDFLHHRVHPGPESQVQALFAGTSYHAANGATMVIPGSHKWDDDRPPRVEEAVPAEMTRGSCLIHLGSTYHGGGANVTKDEPRLAMVLAFARGYLRQEENQYLAVPKQQVLKYPERIQRLLGWDVHEPYCGWWELQDPHVLLRGQDSNVVAAHDLLS
ncbi:phytanoyl-CoA dioxygenase family protein [Dactylosporangium sp. CA-233914]|uniref:phytanoyl-CoA dioxygenase family protein n=1 Tax=Dactylosporangium sp. CA-233914 TaxID=3239934 RepID=UPI003D8AD77A